MQCIMLGGLSAASRGLRNPLVCVGRSQSTSVLLGHATQRSCLAAGPLAGADGLLLSLSRPPAQCRQRPTSGQQIIWPSGACPYGRQG